MLGVLIALLFTAGFVRGATDNARYPACSAVNAEPAPAGADGKCFKSEEWQADLALVLTWGAAFAVGGAALVSVRFAFKASHGLLVLRLLGTGAALLLIAFVVTRG